MSIKKKHTLVDDAGTFASLAGALLDSHYAPCSISLNALRDPTVNPNVMDAERYRMLVEAICTHGFLAPVLVRVLDDSAFEIIDGVHRCRAAREAGLTVVPHIPIRCDARTAAALRIAMNRLRGELDLGIIGRMLAEMVGVGIPPEALSSTGFSTDEVQALLAASAAGTDMSPGGAPPPENELPIDDAPGTFPLTVEFASRADLTRARRGLRKAAGKGGNLAQGLLRLLD